MTYRTYYDVLELNTTASRADVKDAYKKMALRQHPDKNPDDNHAKARFQEVVDSISHDVARLTSCVDPGW